MHELVSINGNEVRPLHDLNASSMVVTFDVSSNETEVSSEFRRNISSRLVKEPQPVNAAAVTVLVSTLKCVGVFALLTVISPESEFDATLEAVPAAYAVSVPSPQSTV